MLDRILDYIDARPALRLLAGSAIILGISFAILLLGSLAAHAEDDFYAPPVNDGQPSAPRYRRPEAQPPEPLDPEVFQPKTCYTTFWTGVAITRCN